MRAAAFLLLALALAAGCDDKTSATDGGTADAAISCGVMPDDAPGCGAIVCPAACSEGRNCGRFCGGGDCYTCSNGTWTRLLYDCIGSTCNVDAGIVVPDASPSDATPSPG